MAGQLWVRVIRKNKIIESRTAPCTYETWQQALDDICHGWISAARSSCPGTNATGSSLA